MQTFLIDAADLAAVRSMVLPSIGVADIPTVLPITSLLVPPIAGRAEALVLQRLGDDWRLFLPTAIPGALPAHYAQGNETLARQLVHDALISFMASQLIETGFLAQVIATTTTIDNVTVSNAVPWKELGEGYLRSAWAALDLLRRPFPIPGRRFLSPAGGAAGMIGSGIGGGGGIHVGYTVRAALRPSGPWSSWDEDRW